MDCPVSVVKMWSGIPFCEGEKKDKINKENIRTEKLDTRSKVSSSSLI